MWIHENRCCCGPKREWMKLWYAAESIGGEGVERRNCLEKSQSSTGGNEAGNVVSEHRSCINFCINSWFYTQWETVKYNNGNTVSYLYSKNKMLLHDCLFQVIFMLWLVNILDNYILIIHMHGDLHIVTRPHRPHLIHNKMMHITITKSWSSK